MDESLNGSVPSRRPVVAVLAFAAVAIAVAGGGYALLKAPGPSKLTKVTIATADQPVGAILYVALANGYFEDEGLLAVPERRTSGKDALKAVIEGEADLCEVAETPVVFAVLKGTPVYTLATIASTGKNMAVVARKDRGISAPADLEGKKIGVTVGTNGEFFLSVFLVSPGAPSSPPEMVNVRPEEMHGALVDGKVDAVSTWNPHVIRLQKKLGDNAVTFTSEGLYTWAWNLAATREFVTGNPKVIEKALRAAVRAQKFIQERPTEARKIVAAHIGMDMALLEELWDAFHFRVSLEQWLLVSMENQAKWAIGRKLTDAKEVPNYLESVHFGALESVKPDAVTMIH